MTTVEIRVQPNARSTRLSLDDGRWRLRITTPPVDGRANKEVIRYLAREVFGIARSRIQLVRGQTSRQKTFEVDLPEPDVQRLLLESCDAA